MTYFVSKEVTVFLGYSLKKPKNDDQHRSNECPNCPDSSLEEIPDSRSEAGNTQNIPRRSYHTENYTFKQPIYQRGN